MGDVTLGLNQNDNKRRMGDSRTKNATRNIVFGFLNRVVSMILPFATRTIILYLLGANYLGIGSLFTSVLSFLSLAELGFSAAIVYSMYRPVAEKDYAQVGALLNFFRNLYRGVGATILLLGTGLAPFLPILIKGEPPAGVNVYVLYYIYLVNSVIGYFFAGYRNSLLHAFQRNDIISNIGTSVYLFVQLAQIAVLYATKNFYAYAFAPIVGTLLSNAVVAYITRRRYPEIKPQGKISREMKRAILTKISGLFGTKLNSIVVHSTDALIISAFLGLTATAQFGNYHTLFAAVSAFIMTFFGVLTPGIGNKIALDSPKECRKLFENLSFVNEWLVGVCCACFLCLYEPFMILWVGEELALGLGFAICMTLYFFIYMIQRTVLTFKDAAGIWAQDKARPYASMTINVISCLILVRVIGIYGVVLSTVLAFTVSLPWANYVLFKNLFGETGLDNLGRILRAAVKTSVISAICYWLCGFCSNNFLGLLERFSLCILTSNALWCLVSYKQPEYAFAKARAVGLLGGLSKKLRRLG